MANGRQIQEEGNYQIVNGICPSISCFLLPKIPIIKIIRSVNNTNFHLKSYIHTSFNGELSLVLLKWHFQAWWKSGVQSLDAKPPIHPRSSGPLDSLRTPRDPWVKQIDCEYSFTSAVLTKVKISNRCKIHVYVNIFGNSQLEMSYYFYLITVPRVLFDQGINKKLFRPALRFHYCTGTSIYYLM